ncbi:MAG: MFS transporter [Symbiobacteriia bacterium]
MYALVNVAQVLVIFNWMVYAAMVPSVMRDLHLSHWEAGLPITVLLAVMALMQFVGGALADRFPEGLISMTALASAVIAGVLAASSHSLALLVLSRAFNGLAAGLSFIAGMRLAARLFTGHRLAFNMGIFGSMVNVGILASSLVAPPLEVVLGWRGVFWVSAAAAAVVMALFPLVGGRTLMPGRQLAGPKFSLVRELPRLADRGTWVAALCHTASFGILLAASSWFPSLLTGILGITDSVVGRWMGAFALVGLVGRMSGANFAARLGARTHVAISLALLGVSLAAMAVFLAPGTAGLTLVLVLVVGGLSNQPFSTLMAEAATRDREHAGSALGALNMIALGGAMVLPVGFGWFKDWSGSFRPSLLFFAAVAWAGMLLSRYLPGPAAARAGSEPGAAGLPV